MIDERKLVRDFCVAVGQPAPAVFTPLSPEQLRLRAALILEEALEFVNACGLEADVDHFGYGPKQTFRLHNRAYGESGSTPDQVDALQDLKYVVFGAEVTMGLDGDPFFEAVHAANMQKLNGPVSPEGKRLKPAGWQPPPIGKMVDDLRARESAQLEIDFEAAKAAETSDRIEHTVALNRFVAQCMERILRLGIAGHDVTVTINGESGVFTR